MKKKAAQPIKDKELLFDIQDYLKLKNERDYIMFVLGISTGYRAGDLVTLRVRDIKKALQNEEFEILESKKENWGRNKGIEVKKLKLRRVKLINNLAKILKAYIKDKKDYEYIFASRKGINSHISVSTVGRILREAGEAFGMKHISAHTMRKTYAYFIYKDSNYDIVVVKEMLGHSSVEITKLYLGLEKGLFDKHSDSLNNLIR